MEIRCLFIFYPMGREKNNKQTLTATQLCKVSNFIEILEHSIGKIAFTSFFCKEGLHKNVLHYK